MGKPKPAGISDEEMDDMPDRERSTMSRWALGSKPTDVETQQMADYLKSKRQVGNRNMFDSPQLQSALEKLNRRK